MASSGNFMTFNPLVRRASSYTDNEFSHSNLRLKYKVGNGGTLNCGFKLGDGKFYFEIYIIRQNSAVGIGIMKSSVDMNNYTTQGPVAVYRQEGRSNVSANSGTGAPTANSSYGENMVADDIVGCAVDFTNSTINWYRNNSAQGAIDISGMNDGTEYLPIVYGSNSDIHLNCGQDSTFAGLTSAGGNADANGFGDFKYSPPSGFLAMCTANLPISDDIDPAQTDDNIPQKNFGVVTFDGNGTSNAVTGLGFKPDLIWGFTRDGSQSKRMVDSSRGGSSRVHSDTTGTETTGTVVISEFGTDGFTANGGQFNNDSGKACGAWCWRANGGTTATDDSGDITVTRQTNDASKFTIATWTGNGTSGSTIAHGLGKKPAMTIIKRLNATSAFNVWHQGNNNGDVDSFGELQGNAQWYQNQGADGPYTTDPTTSLLTLTAYAQVNATGGTYLGYFWADVEGMQRFGSYKGNGNADGPFIYTGFRPRMVFLKRVDNGHNWITFDTATKTFNPNDEYANWDLGTASAQSATDKIDVLSNGWKIRSTGSSFNNNGSTFVYGAWGDIPFKYNNTLP